MASMGPGSITAADLDGDGTIDLAIGSAINEVSVLKNHGDGTFAAAVHYPVSGGASSLAAVDMDGDGALDLVTAGATVLANLGDGTFAPAVGYDAGQSAGAGAIADLDGDGRPDVIVTSPASGTVSVLRNVCLP
jgi:hypothetical protein